jgi:hypothetical protein
MISMLYVLQTTSINGIGDAIGGFFSRTHPSQAEARRKRVDESDASTKSRLETPCALTALSLSISVNSLS